MTPSGQSDRVDVIFLPEGVSVEARVGDTLLDAALDHGVNLPHECGGNCACTTCHVQIVAGGDTLSAMEEVERERLDGADDRSASSRLGCQAILRGGEVTVLIVETGA